ncbi:GumC family protein [Maribacter luteus]|uniref:Polysaccharide chain length determinant N-terminal domain-containing protein n=1 Tax=Maribacter luteus TaxID=2594478 RepID=A0A6I2MUG7_9FLAO|nr:hypothetical protein [Maribacter luteus]MRX66305.1 hypothetical protein [Maribacter luteus]
MKFNLLFFIRLLLRHIGLLVGVPILLGVMVFLLTQNQPKVFSSKARVYTGISSGSGIDLENTKIDYRGTGIAYGNLLNLIKSRSTLEIVGLKLFAQHMALDSADNRVISVKNYEELVETVPDEVKALVVKGNPSATYDNFVELKNSDNQNYIYELVNLDHPIYSIEKISGKIGLNRVPSSDFIDIAYESEDPAICQNALLILCDVFVRLNTEMGVNQSDVVVKYFEGQLGESTEHLRDAEDDLLQFNKKHNIINYYEQTKHIAGEKEEFEIKFFQVQREFSGAKAVLEVLESKLQTHDKKRIASQKIIDLRKELSTKNFDLAMLRMNLERDSTSMKKNAISILEAEKNIKEIENQLNAQVDTIYNTDYDTKGVASSSILSDWLQKTIEYEDAKAQLKVMEKKKLEFEKLYQVFSPLGATMKRLERKIDIAEREYLSLLHSLGLAKLRQQNVQLKSNIKLTEAPFFPINPKPSKRILLVIVAALAGFIVVTLTILILEFLDGNLNTAKRAEEKIGLEVSSIFPVIKNNDKNIDYEYIKNKAVTAISRNIILNQFKKNEDEKPVVNMLFSTQEDEGKTFICQNLIANLCELDYSILHVTYDTTDLVIDHPKYSKVTYPISDRLFRISSIGEFDVENTIPDYNIFDFVILEIPSIIKNPFPVKLASTMDYTFLVTRANRAWTESDKNALRLFNEATTGPEPTIILNGVKVLEMETVIGELPKKRSIIRRWVKQLVQFRFFTKKSVA